MSLKSMSTEKPVLTKSTEAASSEKFNLSNIISFKFLDNLEGVTMLKSLGVELQAKVSDVLLKWRDLSPTDLLNPTTLKELREDISALIPDNEGINTISSLQPFAEFDGGPEFSGED